MIEILKQMTQTSSIFFKLSLYHFHRTDYQRYTVTNAANMLKDMIQVVVVVINIRARVMIANFYLTKIDAKLSW